MSTYPMSEDDRAIQERARGFIDEDLIPWEQHAEEHDGEIPEDERAKHHDKAIELGLFAMNMPKELGGAGMTTFQQVLVSEQIGRVTNALGWCVHTPPAWAPAVVTPSSRWRRWIVPTIRGEMPRVLRDHRGGRRLRRRRHRGHRPARRRRLRPQRREVARDVASTTPPTASSRPSSPAASTRASTPCSSSTSTRPACGWCARPPTPTPTPTTIRSSRSRTSGCPPPT